MQVYRWLGRRINANYSDNNSKIVCMPSILVSADASSKICMETLKRTITDHEFIYEKNARETHIVIDNMTASERWLVCYGISKGMWIVKKEWLIASLESGTLPNERGFEAVDIAPSCKTSRIGRERGRMLFPGPKIKICPPVAVDLDYLMDIVHNVGIVPTEIDRAVYCLCEQYPEGPRVCGIAYVNMLWLTDSIIAGSLKDVEEKYLPVKPCNDDLVACAIGRKPCFDLHLENISAADTFRLALVCVERGGEPLMDFVAEKYNESPDSFHDDLFCDILNCSLEKGNLECMKRVIGLKKDLINMKDADGRNMLHMSLKHTSSIESFGWLLSTGVRIERDSFGFYPLDYIGDDGDLFRKFDHFQEFHYIARSEWFLGNIKKRYTVSLPFERGFNMNHVKAGVDSILCADQTDSTDLFRVCPNVEFEYNNELGKGDGVTRDWFQSLEGLLEDHSSLFLTENGTYYLSEDARDAKFIGNLFGLAFLHQDTVRLSIPMCPLLFKFIVKEPLGSDDIRHLDERLYHDKFEYLRSIPNEDLEDLELTFTHVEYNSDSASIVSPLKTKGASIQVTRDNLEEYLKLFAIYEIYTKRKTQIDDFVDGFNRLVPSIYFVKKVFARSEIQSLLSGEGGPINVQKWKDSTIHIGMHDRPMLISWVWEVINELSDEDKRQLLLFSTGSKSIPSEWEIVLVSDDPSNLPTAQTCTSTMCIYPYLSKSMVRQRFSAVIEYQKTNQLGFQFV